MDDPTAAEDASLAAAETQLPRYLVTDSEDSDDDKEYIPTSLFLEVLMMMRQDPPVQHEPLLLQFPLHRSHSQILLQLYLLGYQTSRTGLLQLS